LVPSSDLAGEQSWSSLAFYSKSKLANVQFTVGLADRLSKYPNIKAMSLHPGVVDSDFATRTPCCSLLGIFKCLCCCCYVDTETGARTSLYLSKSDFKALRSGEFYDSDTTIGAMNELGRNKQQVEDLWRVSEQIFKI
jgi:retinol dehydrogenase-14